MDDVPRAVRADDQRKDVVIEEWPGREPAGGRTAIGTFDVVGIFQ